MPPDPETVPVAIDPRVDGVPAPVQYASCPMVGVLDVETAAVMVAPEPPTRDPNVPFRIMPPPFEIEDVATDWIPAAFDP